MRVLQWCVATGLIAVAGLAPAAGAQVADNAKDGPPDAVIQVEADGAVIVVPTDGSLKPEDAMATYGLDGTIWMAESVIATDPATGKQLPAPSRASDPSSPDGVSAAAAPAVACTLYYDPPTFPSAVQVRSSGSQICSNVQEHRVKARNEAYFNSLFGWQNGNWAVSSWGGNGSARTAYRTDPCTGGKTMQHRTGVQGQARALDGQLGTSDVYRSTSVSHYCPNS